MQLSAFPTQIGMRLKYTSLHLFSILLISFCANAKVIVYEDFEDYDVGKFQSGTSDAGRGWAKGWNVHSKIGNIVHPDTNMNYKVPYGGVVTSGSRALQISGNSKTVASRDFDAAVSDEIYTAFLLHAEPGSSFEKNDFLTVWLGKADSVGAPSLGLKSNEGPKRRDIMGRVTGPEEAYASHMVVGEVYYIVGRLYKEGGSSTYNRYDVWVNPSADEKASPDITAKGSIDYEEFTRMGIRTFNLQENDSFLLDSYMIATEWDDVVRKNHIVGIPERSSSALYIVLSALLFSLIRRKRALLA